MRFLIVGLRRPGQEAPRVAGPECAARGRSRGQPRPTSATSRTCRSTSYDARAGLHRRTSRRSALLTYLLEQRQARAGGEAAAGPSDDARHRRARSARTRATAPSATPPTTTASSRTTCACATSIAVGRARARSIAAACSTATAPRAWCAIRAWRDRGAGVLPDLGSHLLDTARFWFGDIGDDFRVVSVEPLREPRARPRRDRLATAQAAGSSSR